jgi:hypothetical protein
MSLPLPAPTLDHVVVNTRDRLDEAVDIYRRLGFTMTPRGHHSLGSMNHLAMFGTDYLELLAAGTGQKQRPDIMQNPIGLNGLVFGTDDSAAAYEACKANGVPIDPPMEFTRPVQLASGARDAVFRTVTLVPGTIPAGRIYFCHHFTRDLVWRNEWRHHANGTVGITRAVIAADKPDEPGSVFARMFGRDALRPIRGGERLLVGLSSFDIVTPNEVAVQFGDAAPSGDGRAQYMAALTLRTHSLARVREALRAGNIEGVRDEDERVVVPAAQAIGVVLEFRE